MLHSDNHTWSFSPGRISPNKTAIGGKELMKFPLFVALDFLKIATSFIWQPHLLLLDYFGNCRCYECRRVSSTGLIGASGWNFIFWVLNHISRCISLKIFFSTRSIQGSPKRGDKLSWFRWRASTVFNGLWENYINWTFSNILVIFNCENFFKNLVENLVRCLFLLFSFYEPVVALIFAIWYCGVAAKQIFRVWLARV